MSSLQLLDALGQPLKRPSTQQEKDEPDYRTFTEWCSKSIITTNRAAWEYKDKQIEQLLQCFDAAVAIEIKNTSEALLVSLKEKTKTIEDLKVFIEENITMIQSLEKKLGEQGIIADA